MLLVVVLITLNLAVCRSLIRSFQVVLFFLIFAHLSHDYYDPLVPKVINVNVNVNVLLKMKRSKNTIQRKNVHVGLALMTCILVFFPPNFNKSVRPSLFFSKSHWMFVNKTKGKNINYKK